MVRRPIPMSKLVDDIKRLWKHAALIGFVVALTCHIVPSQYRTACDAIAQLCQVDR